MYTGWRRPIGCLMLQVIFRKRATNYRALLRKTTWKDKASKSAGHKTHPRRALVSKRCMNMIYIHHVHSFYGINMNLSVSLCLSLPLSFSLSARKGSWMSKPRMTTRCIYIYIYVHIYVCRMICIYICVYICMSMI